MDEQVGKLTSAAAAMRRTLAALVSLGALLAAGCGSSFTYSPHPANNTFSITPATGAITTNGHIQLHARLATGAAAAVDWSVTGGQNDGAIGEGRIDATGLYTPPPALDRDAAQILITARLQDGAGIASSGEEATAVLTVTPGFLQPLTPETATLAPNATLQISGEIAEVNGGSIAWTLDSNSRVQDPGSQGALLAQDCQRSARNYTTCTAIYKAPSTLPSGSEAVSVRATIVGAASTTSTAPVSIRLNQDGITSTPLTNQAVQPGPIELGASGGNNNDYDSDSDGNLLECCGGTLGALVAPDSGSGIQYILSNNHVLAESDQAQAGDTILQPGLIDTGCSTHPARGAGRPIGALKYYVPLATAETNVDAALALASPGAVRSDGAILQLATPQGAVATVPGPGLSTGSLAAAPPAAGKGEPIGPSSFAGPALEVAKSGRTTGLTCSTIDAIDLDVEVDYFKDCAETQPYYTKTFTGQLGIPGDSFADSGDSGALIVDSRNAEAIGLLFATGSDNGSNGYSVANPIRDVLTELGAQAGQQLSIVGGEQHPVACLNYNSEAKPSRNAAPVLDAQALANARDAVQTAKTMLMHRSAAVLGVTLGRSADNPRDPALIVYADRAYIEKTYGNVGSPGIPAALPSTINGLRTAIVPTDAQSVDSGVAPLSPSPEQGMHLPAATINSAAEIQHRYAKQLMADPAIFGVGVTQSYDNPAEAALLILVDAHRTPRATPPTFGGLRVRYVYLDRLHVTKSKFAGAPHPSTCALQSRQPAPWTMP